MAAIPEVEIVTQILSNELPKGIYVGKLEKKRTRRDLDTSIWQWSIDCLPGGEQSSGTIYLGDDYSYSICISMRYLPGVHMSFPHEWKHGRLVVTSS